MDIRNIDVVGASTKGYEFELINPASKEGMGIFITVKGAMSPEYKDDMVILNAEIDDYNEQIDADLGDKPSKKKLAEAQNKKNKFDVEKTCELLAKYTIGWRGMVEDSKEVEFSKDAAKRIYQEYPIIRGQAQSQMMQLANFIKG